MQRWGGALFGLEVDGRRVERADHIYRSEVNKIVSASTRGKDLEGLDVDRIGSENSFQRIMSDTSYEILPPFETTDVDETGLAKLQTSLIRVPLRGRHQETRSMDYVTDGLIVITLNPEGQQVRSDNLALGHNYRYGALLRNKGTEVEFMKFGLSAGSVVVESVQRKDITEENGYATDSSLVRHQKPHLISLPVETYSEEYFELVDELKKAVDFYKSKSLTQTAEPNK